MHAIYDAIDAAVSARAPGIVVGDTLTNLVSGLGTDRDKATGGRFVVEYLERSQLEAMYVSDWLAGAIVDAPADDMTRKWRRWLGAKKAVAALGRLEVSLGVRRKVNRALKHAGAYGGGAILIGTGDRDPSKELSIDRLPKGGIKYLHSLSRHEIWAGEMDRDPLSPYFGEPTYYELASPTKGGVRIHPSRVVRFLGLPHLETSRELDGWGMPIYQRAYDAVRNVASTAAGLASLVQEAKVDVVKIERLTENATDAGWRERMLARLALAAKAKGINGMLLLDALEEYEQKKLSLADIPGVATSFLEMASGASGIPLTRLLGKSPGGLGSNGDGEDRHYYDRISARQENELRPALSRLDRALARHVGADPDGLTYEWEQLWQHDEADWAEIGLKRAKAAETWRKTGLIPFEALAKGAQSALVEDGTYPALAEALETAPPVKEPPTPAPSARPIAARDSAPRTLYVKRTVRNADEILAWARSQGFHATLRPEDLHVTVAFSRRPVDWGALHQLPAGMLTVSGGPREVKRLGDKGAVVLRFDSRALAMRWAELLDGGASWDHPGYQPHVTLTYAAPQGLDPASVEPYHGPIVLGPEEFAEVDEDWSGKVKETRAT